MVNGSVYVLVEQLYRANRVYGIYSDLLTAKSALLKACGIPEPLKMDPQHGTYWNACQDYSIAHVFELNKGHLELWLNGDLMPFRIQWTEVQQKA